jgi:hypothetical protein
MSAQKLTLEQLTDAVKGRAAAFRARITLQPVDGVAALWADVTDAFGHSWVP